MTNEESGKPVFSIGITQAARELVSGFRSQSDKPEPERLAIWVEVTGVNGSGFSYDMYLKYADDAGSEDEVVQVHDDLKIVVPADSLDKLRGSTIDLSAENGGSLFVDNPNSPSPVVSARRDPPPELTGEVAERLTGVLDQQINPAIAAHGGYCELVAVEDSTAYVRLSGGCQGCGMAAVSLTQGVEVAIREVAPEITRVVDVTDHDAGTNPYFEPAKGAEGGK